MNVNQIAEEASKQTGLPIKTNEAILRIAFEKIKGMSIGEKITIKGFGTFTKIERASRTARNPRTGASVITDAKELLKFKYNG